MSEPDPRFKRKSGTEIYFTCLATLVGISIVLWAVWIVWKVVT